MYAALSSRVAAGSTFPALKDEEFCEQQPPTVSPSSSRGPSTLERLRRSRVFTLTIFTAVVVLLFSDQNLMAPNLSAIAAEFGFSDEEKDRRLGGDIAVAFFGFGAPASLVVGWLTDVVDRRKLFVAIVLVGELGALVTVFVTTFAQLFWARAITGIAIGGGIPLVFSIMGDLVGSSRRTEASGAIGISIGVGQGMGQVVAGFTGRCTSLGWRFPFLLVALPCLVLTAVVFVATRDPPRGRREQGLQQHFQSGGEYKEQPTCKGLRLLWNSPTVVMVMLQGLPGCVPWGVISVYLNDFLHKQRGLTVEKATVVIVLCGVAASAGQLVGAKIGQLAYNRRPMLQPLLMGTTTLAGVLPCILMIRYMGGVFAVYAMYAVAGGFLAAVTGPNIKSVLMNVTLPSTRGTAFGVFNLFDDLGRGLGPAFVSVMISRGGREDAFTLAMLVWVVCGGIHLGMAWTVQRDERKVQAYLLEYAKRTNTDKSVSVSPVSFPMMLISTRKYAAVSGGRDDDDGEACGGANGVSSGALVAEEDEQHGALLDSRRGSSSSSSSSSSGSGGRTIVGTGARNRTSTSSYVADNSGREVDTSASVNE